jgi:hypothetical protein
MVSLCTWLRVNHHPELLVLQQQPQHQAQLQQLRQQHLQLVLRSLSQPLVEQA